MSNNQSIVQTRACLVGLPIAVADTEAETVSTLKSLAESSCSSEAMTQFAFCAQKTRMRPKAKQLAARPDLHQVAWLQAVHKVGKQHAVRRERQLVRCKRRWQRSTAASRQLTELTKPRQTLLGAGPDERGSLLGRTPLLLLGSSRSGRRAPSS